MPRYYALIVLALAVLCAVSAASAKSVADNKRASEASSATSSVDEEAAGGEGSSSSSSSQQLPLEYFPLMQPFQRCLFVCRHCYQHQVESRLLHCANSWCLTRVRNSLQLPGRAYQECPAMRLVD